MRVHEAKNVHSEFINTYAFSLQQLLHERAPMLSCAQSVLLFVMLSPSTQMTGQYLDHLSGATFQALSNSTFASRSTMYNMVYVALIFRKIQEDYRSLNLQQGLLQTKKTLNMSTCVHGWPLPKSSTSDTGLHAMFNYIRYTQLGYSNRRRLENGHISRRSANWHSGHTLRLSTSCTHTSSHADTTTVTGSWKRNGKCLIFALQVKKTPTLSRTRKRKQTK